MALYNFFSYNVEIQYRSCFLSKAMVFTVLTTSLNIVLPFFVAYKSRGFWLRSHYFYEQPVIHFTYEYMLVAESDDPSKPIVCGDTNGLYGSALRYEENCAHFQVQEYDYNGDGKNDILNFKTYVDIPQQRKLTSLMLILILDFQFKTVCPLHMKSLAVINKEFVRPPSILKYYGDLQFYQISHLPCKQNVIDTKYNVSLFDCIENNMNNLIDTVLENYFKREVTTNTKPIYTRSQNGHTGSMEVQINLRVPEMQIRYIPSLLQEFKWAWPQYLSLAIVLYWILNKIKMFVFQRRLFMAWEVVPWKRHN